MRTITAAAARRAALAAQGFAGPARDRATGPALASSRRAVLGVVRNTQLLQLDSVAAVVRAHYAPVFARIGAYDPAALDEAAWGHSARRPRRLVEYWAHEAALIPVADWPLLRWRMAGYEHGRWGGARRVLEENPRLPEQVLAVIAEVGACTAAEVERQLELNRPRRKDHWGWNHSDTKVVCEMLFATGELSVDKRVGFQRHYDLTERVLPAEIVRRRVEEPDAVRELVRRAAAALGVATEADLRDYYRLHRRQCEPAVAELVDAGELEPVQVDGWDRPAYLRTDVRIPRRIERRALLCPFDPLIFFRPRTERLFDFHYRIEIYTPEHKRVHGYYVFPFLLDGELVARVDLRADRATGRLRVLGAFAEPDRPHARIAHELAAELEAMAEWLGLDDVVVGERGDLAATLHAEVAAREGFSSSGAVRLAESG
ncbi:winged helix-turn-helix domain-containing protein [Nocardia veterana]|uniref:Winged helix-turn-helix domain-containing protein n=1 Tax=Nocardia veterana TaxID=132249 RepID=A0A7X6LZW5_9NOCA|nr:crosslink repair DNA glycosylase YcaQ family protein [Nocardia veterana]NKY86905.1 winged helix-turn-helix domain-containing protein [Nocardia veterana]